MLMYGTAKNIIDTGAIFNLTSLREGFISLNYLIPPNQIGKFTGRDFDLAYANYIMNNDVVFKQFFDIVYLLYCGTDVFIMISEENWSENLVESLFKLIQQRYGYNATKINCFDDFVYATNNQISEFNTSYGLSNLDIDKERYTYIVESERIRCGGKIDGEV